ncbi:YpdA family putative bacillithiol disulfide reductase [Pseudogracilibacillus sp. SO30301A]|uniref:YpdA family putative bacillithiol disulfide reductase n=1 Tax=Pseudogracilibacillus sp. SO30301A TaxID=3098291 RepID=UPI00300E0AA9
MIEHTIIVGAGPCGLSCALELQRYNIRPLIIEKGNIVETIYRFPTHQTFFSTSKNLEIGDFPFITDKFKPVRNEALAYYREVVKRNKLRIHPFEAVRNIIKKDELFYLYTNKNGEEIQYIAKHVIIATGYYDQPQYLNIPGENLPKVMHYFKEGHPYYNTDVVIIGGKNSAVDAALALYKAGANITVLYRGSTYSKSIKPWILPDFDSLIQKGRISMEFHAIVTEITENNVIYRVNNEVKYIKNDFVFAMTGYQPNISFFKKIGVNVDNTTGKPEKDENTFETNIPNLYVAGVIISGFNGNETFIENGRWHGKAIAASILKTNHK